MKRELKIKSKEMLSIPNCMSCFRIILVPFFCLAYLWADSPEDYYLASGIIMLSTITDFLDGFIARRFQMITEFGKFLDPLADKLTHAAIAICLITRFTNMKYLFALMLIKEGFMAIMGLINLKHGRKLEGAALIGKFCTASLFIVFIFLIIFPQVSLRVANILIIFEIGIMVLTFFYYIRVFYHMRKTWD